MYICDFSRSVGAGSATTRNTRGLTLSVIALIVPPLPAPSRPSKTTQTLSPLCLTHSCSLTSSTWSFESCFSYSFRFNLPLRSSPLSFDAFPVLAIISSPWPSTHHSRSPCRIVLPFGATPCLPRRSLACAVGTPLEPPRCMPAPVSAGIRRHASVTAREHPERSPCRASPRPDSLANRMRGLPQLVVAHRREIAPVTLVLLRASRSRGVATWRDSPRGASRIET